MFDKFAIFETHIRSFEIKYSIANIYKTFHSISSVIPKIFELEFNPRESDLFRVITNHSSPTQKTI